MKKDNQNFPSPIFELGKMPGFQHVDIQKREYRTDGKWYYAIRNNYNPWSSGWADEDAIIKQINEHQNSTLQKEI